MTTNNFSICRFMEEEIDKGRKIPLLSHSSKYLKRLMKEKPNEEALKELVVKDPLMLLELLRHANATTYEGLRTVESVPKAIERLGLETSHQLVLTILEEKETEHYDDPFLLDNVKKFWGHSIATSLCAEKIAKLVRFQNTELVRLGGLLHDIGILYIIDILNDLKHRELFFDAREETLKVDLHENLVYEIINRFHTEMGARVLKSMNIPCCEITDIVLQHHLPLEKIEGKTHVMIVALANYLCYELEILPPLDRSLRVIAEPIAESLGISTIKVAAIIVEVIDLQKQLEVLLK